MSFNLIDLVKDQVPASALGSIGSLLGEDSSKTESALGAVIPGLLSGLSNTAQKDGGASLFNTIKDQDDSFLDNIGDALGGSGGSSLMQTGVSLLGSVLGNGAMGSLVKAVAGFSGLGSKSSSGLLGIAAPIVLGIIKRKLFSGDSSGQNAGGLLSLFDSQKDNISAAMPSGFSDHLQSSGFLNQFGDAAENVTQVASNAAQTASNVASDAASSGGGMLKKLLPIIALVVLGFFLWRFLMGGGAEDAMDATKNAVESATSSVMVGDTDIGKEFTGIFGSVEDTFGNISDVETATAAVPTFGEITGKLDGLSGMWDKVPEAGRGVIGGMVSQGINGLTPLIDKAKEIPGVGAIIEPAIEPMMGKLRTFAN